MSQSSEDFQARKCVQLSFFDNAKTNPDPHEASGMVQKLPNVQLLQQIRMIFLDYVIWVFFDFGGRIPFGNL